MRWTTSTRRRAEELAAVVDGTRAPADASAETRAFFEIVSHLREIDAPSMRPEFAADLRTRLMAAAPAALADLPPAPARERTARELQLAPDSRSARGLRIATTTLLLCATAGGVAAASQSALPGDPLYQVKRGLEWVQVTTAGSDQDRGDVLLDQASERLSEAEQLAVSRPDDPTTASLIADALADFESQATEGSDNLVDDYRADGSASSIVEVRQFADESSSRLSNLGQIVPPDAQVAVVDAAGVLTDIDGAARDACELCSPLAPLKLPSALDQLAQTTQSVLDVLPGTLGSATGGDGAQSPPPNLPTLPVLTGGGDGGGGHGGDGQGSHQQQGGGGGGHPQQPQLPLPTGGGSTSSPSLPLPSVPGVPLPTVPLPSVPLPTLPVPTLPLPTVLPLP